MRRKLLSQRNVPQNIPSEAPSRDTASASVITECPSEHPAGAGPRQLLRHLLGLFPELLHFLFGVPVLVPLAAAQDLLRCPGLALPLLQKFLFPVRLCLAQLLQECAFRPALISFQDSIFPWSHLLCCQHLLFGLWTHCSIYIMDCQAI